MQDEVDEAVAGGFGPDAIDERWEPFALLRKGNVTDRGNPARGRGPRSADEVVRPRHRLSVELHGRQVHVHVHAAGEHQMAGAIDLARARHRATELDDAPLTHAD